MSDRTKKDVSNEKPKAVGFVFGNPDNFCFVLNKGTFGAMAGITFGISSEEKEKAIAPLKAELFFYQGLCERMQRYIELLEKETGTK